MQFDSEKLNLIGANHKLIVENRRLQQQLAQKDTIICQLQQENSQLREQIQNNLRQMEATLTQRLNKQNTELQADEETGYNQMFKELTRRIFAEFAESL